MRKKNEFGNNWWTQRWIQALEAFGWDSRLQRGRSYARSGHVRSIEVTVGLVTARVQGSMPSPYRVTIRVRPLKAEQWEKVVEYLSSQAIFAAKLLAGEMPQDIEEAFRAARVALFPTSASDLETDCSCPDWANPCKHVAAVHYVLGAEFDRDPFLLFQLRGRTREEIVQALRARRIQTEEILSPIEQPVEEPAEPEDPPLEALLDRFWVTGEDLSPVLASPGRSRAASGVLRLLGEPPFPREGQEVFAALMDAYDRVAKRARELAGR